MTINDILKIAAASEKEDAFTELKSIRKLISFDEGQQRDIACEIVAFANRHGGRIIFGINDDGTPDPKTTVNIDDIKAKLHELCYKTISPSIDCSTEYLEDGEHQFLVVSILKRKSIPHALVERANGEIKKRTYYIRTSHGKRLVTDTQLEWLFQQTGDPEFNYEFRIGLEFDRQMYSVGEEFISGKQDYYKFRELLATEDKKMLEGDNTKFSQWINLIMPYLVLGSLQHYFRWSWHIGTSDEFDRFSAGPLNRKSLIPDHPINICDIPVTGAPDLGLSWDLKRILKDLNTEPMLFPAGTTVSIEYDNENCPCIYIKSNDFDIEIILGMLSGGAGLHQKSMAYDILYYRDPRNYHTETMPGYLHYDGACYVRGRIKYPDYGMEEYKDYLNYFNSIKNLLDHNWNFEKARAWFGPKEMLILNDKVDEILKNMKF